MHRNESGNDFLIEPKCCTICLSFFFQFGVGDTVI